MRLQINKGDFISLVQSHVDEQFDNVLVEGLTFCDGMGKQHPITRIEIDYRKLKDEKTKEENK